MATSSHWLVHKRLECHCFAHRMYELETPAAVTFRRYSVHANRDDASLSTAQLN